MRLRPNVVNDVLDPATAAVRVFLLLVPENSIFVRHAGDEIGQPITIHILHVNEACRAEIEFRMKNPFSISRIEWRFEPSLRSNNVIPSILIDVTCADAVAVTVLVDDMTNPFCISALARDLVPGKGKILIAELRQELRSLSRVQQIHQEREFYGGPGLNDGFPPGLILRARIFPPSERLVPVGTTNNIRIAVTIHVNRQVAQVFDISARITKVAKMVLNPLRSVPFLSRGRLFIPILPGHNVQAAVLINVGHGNAFAAPQIDSLLTEGNFV